MKHSLLIVSLLVVGVGSLLLGCDEGSVVDESPVASADFAIEVPITCPTTPDAGPGGFYCNYVKIHGVRDGVVDTKYPCDNEVEVCAHFDNAEGKIYSKDHEELRNLCPSNNARPGRWDFWFEIFDSKEACEATPPHPLPNIECPEVHDEYLVPGINKLNKVMCWTHNAEKDFDFDICVFDMTCEALCYKDVNCPEGWTCDKPTMPTVDSSTQGVCRPRCGPAYPYVDCGYDATCVDDCDGLYCRKLCISGCRENTDCVVEGSMATALCDKNPDSPTYLHCVDP